MTRVWLSERNYAVFLATTTVPVVPERELAAILHGFPDSLIGELMVYMYTQKCMASQAIGVWEQYLHGLLLQLSVNVDLAEFVFRHDWVVSKGSSPCTLTRMCAALFHLGLPAPIRHGPLRIQDAIEMVLQAGFSLTLVPSAEVTQDQSENLFVIFVW